MKKTIIALMALAGIACGSEKSVIFDFGGISLTGTNVVNINKEGDYKVYSTSGDLAGIKGTYTFAQDETHGGMNHTATKYTSSTIPASWGGTAWLCMLESTPSGWGDTFKDGLTSQYQSGGSTYTMTFSGLEAGYYDISAMGGYIGADNMVSAVTLTLGGADTSKTTWSSSDLSGSNASNSASGVASLTQSTGNTTSPNPEGYTFDVSKVLVTDGSLTLTIVGGAEYSQRTPLNGLTLTWTAAAPEPTTATLSLLALAGLAARRRRQA